MTQTLIGVLAGSGLGSGGPKRHPASVHWRKAHFAPPQVLATHVPLPNMQSPGVVHGEAQSLSAVQKVPRFDTAPRVQRLPPASAGVVPDSVSAVPLHAVTLVTDWPISGMTYGGTVLLPPPL